MTNKLADQTLIEIFVNHKNNKCVCKLINDQGVNVGLSFIPDAELLNSYKGLLKTVDLFKDEIKGRKL